MAVAGGGGVEGSGLGKVVSSGSIRWFEVGERSLSLGWSVDSLTAIMLLVVGVVATCVVVFSIGYLHGDAGWVRYFALLSLFTGAMNLLVIASTLTTLFIGWELVGACSYLLIGFWYQQAVGCGRSDQGVPDHPRRRRGAAARHRGALDRDRDGLLRGAARQRRPHPGVRAGRGHGLPGDRSDGQVRAVPAPCVAARCDGRPHAGLGAHPCRHDGGRGRLPRRAPLAALRARRLQRGRCCSRPARSRRSAPRWRRWRSETSRRCSRTRRSASSDSCSPRSGPGPGSPRSSTW